MPHSVASDLGLHRLSMSHHKDTRLIWVNECNRGKHLNFELGSIILSTRLTLASYKWRLSSSVDNLCKQFEPRSECRF